MINDKHDDNAGLIDSSIEDSDRNNYWTSRICDCYCK